MKTLLNRYDNILFGIIALVTGFGIDSYYSSFMPDFDIGFYEVFTAFRCWLLILFLWGIVLGIFYILKKQIDNRQKRQLISVVIILAYWLIIRGFCYYQYIIKAMKDWNDMMSGNVG